MPHTPGPWRTEEYYGSGTRIIRAADKVVGYVAVNNADDLPLLLSAPDLLAALQGLVAVVDQHATKLGWWADCGERAAARAAARAAIVLAKGWKR